MKKKLLLITLLFLMFMNCSVFAKTKKIKCQKPIYYFENVKMPEMLLHLEESLQKGGYQTGKYYPEIGYLEVKYKAGIKASDYTPVLLKQSGNDIYLFFDIDKKETSLDKYIYKELKIYSKNSYPIKNELFCINLTKDAKSAGTKQKLLMPNTLYTDNKCVMDLKRYIGFDKKIKKTKTETKEAQKIIKENDKAKKLQELKQQGLGSRW